MLLVHLGSPEEGERFFQSHWPEARAVSSEDEGLYEAFGLSHGSIGQLFGPRVFLEGLKAVRYGVGLPVGNPLRMSGWFLLDRAKVIWSHVHEHAGAPLRHEEAVRAYRALRTSGA